MTGAREWRYRRAVTGPGLALIGSSGSTGRRGLHRVRCTGWSFALGVFAASMMLSAASSASASSVGSTRPSTGGCRCAASAAAAGGIPASHGQVPSGNGNGNAYGHDRGQSAGVVVGQHPGLGTGNGQDNNPLAAPQAPAPRGGGGHQTNGAASHWQGGKHGHQGNGLGASPQHAAGPGHANRAAASPPPWAASRRASASRRAATTPAAVSPAALTATAPPAAGDSSAATGQAGRAPRIARRRSSPAQSSVRRRRRSASSRPNIRVAAAPGARARRAQASGTTAPGATASAGQRRSSGTPANGPNQTRTRTGTAGGEGFLSLPLALPRTIERLVRVVPTAVWLALLAATTLAAAAAAAAILAARRARRQARAIAVAERDAATDPLTGVLNRRGFGDAVDRELARARRHDHPFALAYLDVRGLKAVNDGDGHLVGDELIKQVASLLRDCARGGDVVGRLGGDEFALLLAEQSAEGAARFADRLRACVPGSRASIRTDVSWDLTIATASYPGDGNSFETLLSAADRRLYAQRGIQLGTT